MLQLTKKVEYALMALSHMAGLETGSVVTVRDVSERYNIPSKLLAKIFHRMKKHGLVRSHQGKHGGYSLIPRSSDVSLSLVISVFEDSSDMMICVDSGGRECRQHGVCNIRGAMGDLNQQMQLLLSTVTLRDFAAGNGHRSPA